MKGAVDVLDITEMATELQQQLGGQKTLLFVYKEDYIRLVVQAIKKFFVDVNHPDRYDWTLFTTNQDEHVGFDYNFNILQEEYIYILARLFYKRAIYSEFSGDGAISYTTNALSVTGAKEGYKSIKQEIDDLERERLIVFHKMMAHEES